MILVIKPGVSETKITELKEWLLTKGVGVDISVGKNQTVMGLIGETDNINLDQLKGAEIIKSIKRITTPVKAAERKNRPEKTVIDINGIKLGNGHFHIIAGPCAVESREQLLSIAESVKASGASILRGGAFKGRTSPFDFQGLGEEGLQYLQEAKKLTKMPIVSEIMSPQQLPLFEDVDVLQVGARNMQNYELLKELGQIHKPVILKRSLSGTIKELLLCAEYIISGGNQQVILCERGIRTFEHYTRNTLDLSAVPLLHSLTNLPVIVDPSHGTGIAWLVEPMAMAAAAAGADGLMIEVHNDPIHAKSDGFQALTTDQFETMAKKVFAIREAIR